MANMDYCKFSNTSTDIDQCLRAIEDGQKTSAYECEKAEHMFSEVLVTMADLGIIEEWDEDLLHDYCQAMNEDE